MDHHAAKTPVGLQSFSRHFIVFYALRADLVTIKVLFVVLRSSPVWSIDCSKKTLQAKPSA